ncbi:hypothetical protein ACFQ95_22905 [Variovorax sp. HJSM1_2]
MARLLSAAGLSSMTAAHLPAVKSANREFGLLKGADAILVRRRVDRWLTCAPVITATFLSKISIPPFGALGLSLAIPQLCLAAAVGVLSGRLLFDARRLQFYILLLSFMALVQVTRGDNYSLPSLLLFGALHFPYVLSLTGRPDYKKVLAFFQNVALVIAILGILQYSIQFAIGSKFAFPLENFFPEPFLVSKFNQQGYLEYGSDVYRANGVFMLEPSFFSQFLAVAIVVEAISFRRLWVFGIFFTGMVVCFSGTGLMLLAACLPCLAIAKRRFDLLAAGAVGLAAVIFLAMLIDHPFLNVFFKRANEFSATGSSGFARFVGGFYLFEQFLWPEPLRGLFGFGAGSLQAYQQKATLPSGGNAFFKMVFEFGIVGGGLYFIFLYYCLARSAAPVMIRVAVGLTYFLSGVYIPFSHALALALVVWPNPPQITKSEVEDNE